MAELLTFPDRAAFRAWLVDHGATSGGVWLRFGKPGGPATLSAQEALEEALCFGWIDGQMQRLGDTEYKKYFALRRPDSKWSEKNKALVQALEARGLLTQAGREKIAAAQKNGQWDAPKAPGITEADIAAVGALLAGHEPAHANFRAMPPSAQKTYARAWLDAKTEVGREKRLAWMIDRLDQNLKPM